MTAFNVSFSLKIIRAIQFVYNPNTSTGFDTIDTAFVIIRFVLLYIGQSFKYLGVLR